MTTDLLTRLAEIIPEIDYFDGKTVVLDTFCGFTKQERNVIAAMLRRCKDVYITLCMDAAKAEDTLLFDNIRDEAEKLKRVCAENSVPVAKSVVCLAAEDTKTPELRTLEANVFRSKKESIRKFPPDCRFSLPPTEQMKAILSRAKFESFYANKITAPGKSLLLHAKKIPMTTKLNAAFSEIRSAVF